MESTTLIDDAPHKRGATLVRPFPDDGQAHPHAKTSIISGLCNALVALSWYTLYQQIAGANYLCRSSVVQCTDCVWAYGFEIKRVRPGPPNAVRYILMEL
jgi:hypothetical protein